MTGTGKDEVNGSDLGHLQHLTDFTQGSGMVDLNFNPPLG